MEKFSHYNDPFSGINPFITPKRQSKAFVSYLKMLLRIPHLFLLVLNVNVVQFLIKIKSNSVVKPRAIAANSSSFLDVYVLRYLTGIKNFYYVAKDGFVDLWGGFHKNPVEPYVLFPEGCRTNNRAVLQFVRDVRVIMCVDSNT